MVEPRKLSVFLCHASQDKPLVRELYQRLKTEGWINPWLDEEKLIPGVNWKREIEIAIESADSVLIFLSTSSVSKESFIQREIKYAWDLSLEKPDGVIFITPLRLDDCQVPRQIKDKYHYADYFGLERDKNYERLLDSLKRRHEQKLQHEAFEQLRADELSHTERQLIKKIRRERDEAFQQQVEKEKQLKEELARKEEERYRLDEAQRIKEELNRKEAEAKAKAILEEKKTDKKQVDNTSVYNFSRYTGSSLLVDGKNVHYESLGRGRPVIFLHGWIGSWRYWLNSMQVTSSSFRAYALDLWGFGDSSHNADCYSLEQQSGLLDRFLNEMGIGRIALVGHGLGALVGMKFASRFPQSVDRMMAISCPLHIGAVNSRLRTYLPSPQELTDWLSPRTLEATVALSDANKADGRAITASLDGLQVDNLYGNFLNLNIPLLLVYGEKDQAILAPDESFPHSFMSHPFFLEGSGHFPMIEEQFLFERLLMRFLRLNSGQNPSEIQL
jgi:pimeloyl-ACP methyl ester carboxylesterase